MPLLFDLRITLRDHEPAMHEDEAVAFRIEGGPSTLLAWLETRLGLAGDVLGPIGRLARFAGVLGALHEPSFAQSLSVDRWGTASELLRRRDALRLAGWRGDGGEAAAAGDGLPAFARDLARVESRTRSEAPGVPERLEAVFDALDVGQRLPRHTLLLAEPADAWPPLWQRVLARLDVTAPSPLAVAAKGAHALATVQRALLDDTFEAPRDVAPDASMVFASARSRFAACHATAAMLAREPSPRTVVVCNDDEVAATLDACLHRLGQPRSGAFRSRGADAVRGVLPASLALLWEPVDPARLIEFLNLPVLPIPRHTARALAAALAEQPGLGSRGWEKTRAKLTAPDADPDGKVRAALEAWFDGPRASRALGVERDVVLAHCGGVARWATGRAEIVGDEDSDLCARLRALATEAAALKDLAALSGDVLSEATLAQLVRVVQGHVHPVPGIPGSGGPAWVRSLAEVPPGTRRLVWLGLSAEAPAKPLATPGELRTLEASGVRVDDGSEELHRVRVAERRGFCRVEDAVLLVSLPEDDESPPHPLRINLEGILGLDADAAAVPVEDAAEALAPWGHAIATARGVGDRNSTRVQVWQVPPRLLEAPPTTSASEMRQRLACPVQWTLHRAAGLRGSRVARLPDAFTLKGDFVHAVLEDVFGADAPADEEAAVAAVLRTFDERLALDAAPLAQPARAGDAARLRRNLEQTTRAFSQLLRDGGWRVHGMECAIDVAGEGRPLRGSIDCVLENDAGEEAIVDVKLAGNHRGTLEDGRALQLAVYARAREAQGKRVAGVAYLVVMDADVVTPSGSPLRGARSQVQGDGVHDTWKRLEAALAEAEGWLASGHVVAQPLAPANEWLPGAELGLEREKAGKAPQRCCTYCEYPILCGHGRSS